MKGPIRLSLKEFKRSLNRLNNDLKVFNQVDVYT